METTFFVLLLISHFIFFIKSEITETLLPFNHSGGELFGYLLRDNNIYFNMQQGSLIYNVTNPDPNRYTSYCDKIEWTNLKTTFISSSETYFLTNKDGEAYSWKFPDCSFYSHDYSYEKIYKIVDIYDPFFEVLGYKEGKFSVSFFDLSLPNWGDPNEIPNLLSDNKKYYYVDAIRFDDFSVFFICIGERLLAVHPYYHFKIFNSFSKQMTNISSSSMMKTVKFNETHIISCYLSDNTIYNIFCIPIEKLKLAQLCPNNNSESCIDLDDSVKLLKEDFTKAVECTPDTSYFSLITIKAWNMKIIAGCGKDTFKFGILNWDMTIITNFEVSISNGIFNDILPYNDKILLYGVKKINNANKYYIYNSGEFEGNTKIAIKYDGIAKLSTEPFLIKFTEIPSSEIGVVKCDGLNAVKGNEYSLKDCKFIPNSSPKVVTLKGTLLQLYPLKQDVIFEITVCGKTCNSCTIGNDDGKCISCNTNEQYYPLANETGDNPKICYKDLNYYYVKENKWEKCYDSCKKCSGAGSENEQNCDVCKDDYIKNTYNPTQCYKEDCSNKFYYRLNDSYYKCVNECGGGNDYKYLIGNNQCVNDCNNKKFCGTYCENKIFYSLNSTCYENCPKEYETDKETLTCKVKCDISCKTCNVGEKICGFCNDTGGYFPIEDDYGKEKKFCYNNLDYHYLNKDKWGKCYDSCKTCNGPGIKDAQNCSSCKDEYTENFLNQTQCYKECNGFFYYRMNDSYYICEENGCPEDYPYLIEGTNQCLNSCDDLTNCGKNCNGKTLYLFRSQSKCITKCPLGYKLDEETKTCVSLNEGVIEENQNENSITYKTDYCLQHFIEVLDDFSSNMVSDKITTVKSDEFSLTVYPTSTNKSEIENKNLPIVHFDQCEGIIRQYYGIPDDEELYMSLLVANSSSSSSLVTNRVKYELYNSKGEKLDLSPCNDIDVLVTMPINRDNINIDFELAAFLYSQGINIYDRNDSIYNDQCVKFNLGKKDLSPGNRLNELYINISFCQDGCKIKSLNYSTNQVECECSHENFKVNSIIEEIPSPEKVSSILNDNNFKLFLCYKLIFKSITYKNNWGFCIMISIIFLIIVCFLYFWCNHVKLINSFLHGFIYKLMNPPNLSNKCERSEISIYINNFKSKHKSSYDSHSFQSSKIFHSSQESLPQELNETEYSNAIEKDKRSCFTTFKDVLGEKGMIASALYGSSKFYPFSFRIIVLFFELSSFLFFIAIFFTEQLISKRYNSTTKSDIGYILSHEFSKIIYALLICFLLRKLLSLFTQTNGDLLKLIRRHYKNKKIIINIKNLFFSMRRKFIVISVIILIIIIMYLYFLTIFSTLFEFNQSIWIIFTIISIGIYIALYILISIIISCLRNYGITQRSECLFQMSLWLYKLF